MVFKKGNHPKTEFKKGQHPSPKTEFKKGTSKELHPRYIDGRSFKKSQYRQGKDPNSRNGFKRKEFHISPLYELIRKSLKYKEWTLKCLSRDNFMCVNCQKKQFLEVHHKKAFSKILKENNIKTFDEAVNCVELWDLNNGITLCSECHAIVDKFRRRSYGNVNSSSNKFC